MLGWLSVASVCASRVKRASRSGSVANEFRQDLDRDVAIEPRVARAVDLTHSACAEGADDFERTDSRARRQLQGEAGLYALGATLCHPVHAQSAFSLINSWFMPTPVDQPCPAYVLE